MLIPSAATARDDVSAQCSSLDLYEPKLRTRDSGYKYMRGCQIWPSYYRGERGEGLEIDGLDHDESDQTAEMPTTQTYTWNCFGGNVSSSSL